MGDLRSAGAGGAESRPWVENANLLWKRAVNGLVARAG